MVEQPGDAQANPQDESEQTYRIDTYNTAHASGPQFADVGHDADREEAQGKEHAAQDVRLTGARIRQLDDLGIIQAHDQQYSKCEHEAQDEFGKAVPNFHR